MNHSLIKLIFAGILVTALIGGGCNDHDHAHAPGEEAGHAHDHDHSHVGEVRESLGLGTVGPYEVVAVQLGKLKPGDTLAFDVEILGQPKPKAVRFWIGDEAAASTQKTPPESEKDNVYHVDIAVPTTVSPQDRLWVEVDPPDGAAARAGFNLKS